jgi:hypothetical protein
MELDKNGSQTLQTITKEVKEILGKNHNVHIIVELYFKKENYQRRCCFLFPRSQPLS